MPGSASLQQKDGESLAAHKASYSNILSGEATLAGLM